MMAVAPGDAAAASAGPTRGAIVIDDVVKIYDPEAPR
jgi:hypothetical protein